MKLPELQQTNDQITMLNKFMGLNKNLRIEEGEFSDMSNITNDYYPAISPRKKRGIVGTLTNPQGILGGKSLSYVDDNKFYYEESYICDLETTDVERQLVAMAAYIVIFPDGVIYNTHTGDIDYIENEVTTEGNPTFSLCKMDGTKYNDSNTVTSDTAPEDTTKYWIDTAEETVVVKMYSTSSEQWVSVGTTYVKVEYEGIGEGFAAYDAATFSGVDTNRSEIYNKQDFNTSNIIYDCGDDYLIIAGLINKVFTNSNPITVCREKPELDYVCELDNRIWGCSSDNHEIYACKLGDPKNWNAFMGLETDSYSATVGTQTNFTGCITYSGYIYFFKEDGYHRLYGNKPSNYEMIWRPCRGVEEGSEKSLCVLNDYLMYKATEGIIIFDGSSESCSEKLGTEAWYDGVAGVYRNKYYISMRNDEDEYRLYVYDSQKNTWCIEDDVHLKYTAYADGGMYMINSNNLLYLVNEEKIYQSTYPSSETYPSEELFPGKASKSGIIEDDFEWSMTTGEMGMDSPYQKYVKRIDIRLTIETGAKLVFEAEYDSQDDWEVIMNYTCTKTRSYSIPVPIKRCDHFKLRISGKGTVRIYSIAKVVENGSDA